MTRPLTPNEILAALKRWGIPYHEQPGWRTRVNGSGWGSVVGFMWHHTGDDAADDVDLRIVRDGRAGLPGPLCQFGLRDDGSVDLVAAGAANHAGGGDPAVLAVVKAQSYATRPPAPRYIHGQAGSIGGNSMFYGCEAYYSGTHAPTSSAARTMPRLAAAIIDALDRIDTGKWTAKRGIGHKEWQRGKVDPGGIDCANLRAQTQALLNAGPVVVKDQEQIMADIILTNPLSKAKSTLAGGLNSTWAYTVMNHALLKAMAAKVGVTVDIDEKTLAAELAPLLIPTLQATVSTMTDAEVKLIAKAVSDEQARRLIA